MSTPNHLVKSQLAAFGANLRHYRQRAGWTLDELAKRSALSRPFLSRLESGDRQASIAAVLTLSQLFGVSIGEMFEPQIAPSPCLIVRKADAVTHKAFGLSYEPLSLAGHLFNLRPMKVTVSPDREGNEHFHHEGEEWIYVISGEITLSLAGEKYDLSAGDAVHFDSRLPHRVLARGEEAPEVLLVASPLSLERRSTVSSLPLKSQNGSAHLLEMSDNEDVLLTPSCI